MNKLLRILRIVVEALAALMITLAIVDYGTGTMAVAGWLVDLQIVPAALSLSVGVLVLWTAVTLLFGRVYCSTVCPMGALQDLVARLRRMIRRGDYHFRPALTRTRRIILGLFVGLMLVGAGVIAALIDPYSAYTRICTYLFQPLWMMAVWKVAAISLVGLSVAVVTLVAVAWFAARGGRTLCNTVCPVGTLLGEISRVAVMHIDIDTDKCIQCRRCEHRCKSGCIDLTDHVVDMSRCVVCFDCLPVCPNDAISYTSNRKQLSIPMMERVAGTEAARGFSAGPEVRPMSRRKFLASGAVAAASLAMGETDAAPGNVAPMETGSLPLVPVRRVTPPGVSVRADFLSHCTGCGLCVSKCPSGVLRPAKSGEYSVMRPLIPVMDFDEAWCYYDCTRCTDVCPTGALSPITVEQKHRVAIGRAVVEAENCIAAVEGVPCGACARRCPVEAIAMTPVKDSPGHSVPVIDKSLCIGCGACEYICPAAPYRAIVVNGIH